MKKLTILPFVLISALWIPNALAQSIKPGLWRDTVTITIDGKAVVANRSSEDCMSAEDAKKITSTTKSESEFRDVFNLSESSKCENIKINRKNNTIHYSATCKNQKPKGVGDVSGSLVVVSPTEFHWKAVASLKVSQTDATVVTDMTLKSKWIGSCDPKDASDESKDD